MRARVARLAYCFAAFAIILMHEIISPVQSTAQLCENGNSSSSIASEQIIEEIGQLNIQLHSIREILIESNEERKSLQDINIKQVQIIKEFFNVSFQQLKNQVDTAVTSLQAVDRQSQDQIERIHQFQNTSLLEMKSQQDKLMTSLQAIDRRAQEQDIYTRFVNVSFQQMKDQLNNVTASIQAVYRHSQEQDVNIRKDPRIQALLDASNQQMKYLNASFQQIKAQQGTVKTSLQAVNRRSQDQDVHSKQVHALLNASNQQINNLHASFEQIKAQQDTVKTSLQTVDRRSQETNVYINQVHALLNASNQQINNLHASFQQIKAQQDTVKTSLQTVDRRLQEQNNYINHVHALLDSSNQKMKSQHDIVLRSLETIDRRLNDHDFSVRSQIQNSWKLSVGLPVQMEIRIDTGGAPVVLPIVNDWIIIMHRFDGSLDFNKNWIEYKNGFGDVRRGELWFGNEKVHRLTNRVGVTYTLRLEVQVQATGRWFYANYATFTLDSERNKYALHLSGYSGNAGDALASTSLSATERHNGRMFSTIDADNDRSFHHCAQQYHGGWWFDACFTSCLTCPYQDLFRWHYVGGWQSSGLLRAARMMMKSK